MNPILGLPTFEQAEVFYMLYQNNKLIYELNPENLGNVALSNTQKDPSISLSDDQLTLYACQGYRTALATHGVSEGTYFYEVQLKYPKSFNSQEVTQRFDLPQARIGFASPATQFDGPVGSNQFGFALRTADCSIVFNKQRYDTNRLVKTQLVENDVIGCLIHLPLLENPPVLQPELELIEQRYVNKAQLNQKHNSKKAVSTDADDGIDEVVVQQMQDKFRIEQIIIPHSFIAFFVNGKLVNFMENIPFNRYNPALSGYNFMQMTCNFGLKNLRIKGYPMEFYTLPFTLISYQDLQQQSLYLEAIGFSNLDWQKALEVDNRNVLTSEWLESVESDEATRLEILKLQPDLMNDNTDALFDTLTFLDKKVEKLPENHGLRFCTKLVYASFLRFIISNQEECQKHDISDLFNTYSQDEKLSLGFQFFPKQNQLLQFDLSIDFIQPFTTRYKIRGEIEYAKIIDRFRKKQYSVRLHKEISKIYHEANTKCRAKSK